jgi:hypothetical protein
MLVKKGSRFVLIIGLFSEGISMLAFALLDYIEKPALYAVLSFVFRAFEGFGNGCCNSGCK